MNKTIKNQKGQGLIEYLIIVALVGVATIGVVRVVGSNLSTQFANVANALGGHGDREIRVEATNKELYKKKNLSDFMKNVQD